MEQQKRGEMGEVMGMIFGGRYMLILMGLFAIYMGMIYNDFMSLPATHFESMWEEPKNATGDERAMIKKDMVYAFGIDYNW